MTPLRALYRSLARAQRRLDIHRVCHRLPRAHPDPTPAGGVVTLAGLLRAPSGIGEGARLNAAALGQLGYSVGLLEAGRPREDQRSLPMPEGPRQAVGDRGGPIIMHLNPPVMLHALADMRNTLDRRRVIAHWVWEAPTMPPVWHRALQFLHEVWVPSRFVANAVATAGAGIPVRIVPYAVRAPEDVTPMDIAGGKLLFLTMFAYDSGFKRKNPVATVAAFRRAFGDRDDVHLLIKAQGAPAKHAVAQRALAAAIGPATNVSILGRDLSARERDALIARADVVVSLHRAEGFGLTLAEAMLLGKPTIATNWSGNVDFMAPGAGSLIDYKLIPLVDADPAYAGLTANWADPDIDHAAAEMRRLTDPAIRAALGAAARELAGAYFTLDALAAAVAPGIGPPRLRSAVSPAV